MQNALTTIPFHGASLIAIQGDKPETTMVAMRAMVEGMKLDWSYQRKKLYEHPVLTTCVAVTAIQMPGDDQVREHVFLPLNRIHFWLATLHPNRFDDPAVRQRVITYQNEAADALFEHFFGRAIEAKPIDQGRIGRQVAAILDDKLSALVVRMLPALVEERFAADPRVAALDSVSVRELLEEHGALQRGRGRLNRKIGRMLKDRALLAPTSVAVRRCPHSKVWLYPRSFTAAFMAEVGRELVAAHNDTVRGQGRLRLVAQRGAA